MPKVPLYRRRHLERILHGKGVHHCRQHAHIVTGGTLHSGGCTRNPTEDIAAADDEADLNALIGHRLHPPATRATISGSMP